MATVTFTELRGPSATDEAVRELAYAGARMSVRPDGLVEGHVWGWTLHRGPRGWVAFTTGRGIDRARWADFEALHSGYVRGVWQGDRATVFHFDTQLGLEAWVRELGELAAMLGL